ncbi:MAG: ATPase [Lachnospiraceae bacterium]|nr:ATPase [Lachnospiraceae bacterium]
MYERMLAEHNRLQHQITSLQKQISQLPEGKLICASNGTYSKWYRSDGCNKTYISKSERRLAEQLAAKKYLSHLLKDYLHQKNAIDFYLRHYNSNCNQAEELLKSSTEYKELLAPYFSPLSEELSLWTSFPYKKNNNYPEQLIHKTASGSLVRSKSEAIIDMFLYTNKIPFRYECALLLGNTTIFPDFTIRHPKTGELYYWEHFGLIDNIAYCQNMHSKLQLYTSNGIMPSIQLITTFETQNNPLSSEMVKKIIEYYFL